MITVDHSSPVPPFEQIRVQFAGQIADYRLVPGTRLPTIRRLASDLGVAVNTVLRAYQELEAAGLVETRGRGGTVVSARGDTSDQRLQRAAQDFAEIARQTGVDPTQALRFVSAALDSATSETT